MLVEQTGGTVLLRFREFVFACLSDSEKAYLVISFSEYDKDAARFLWQQDLFNPVSELIIYRFNVFCIGA